MTVFSTNSILLKDPKHASLVEEEGWPLGLPRALRSGQSREGLRVVHVGH